MNSDSRKKNIQSRFCEQPVGTRRVANVGPYMHIVRAPISSLYSHVVLLLVKTELHMLWTGTTNMWPRKPRNIPLLVEA